MWAIVPLKSPENAKSRLSSALDQVARNELFFAVAQHVIEVLQDTRGISRVIVATASDAVDGFAQWCDVEVIRLPRDAGTNAAFVSAIALLQGMNFEHLLMIGGDLPLLTTAAVQRMIDAARSGAEVVVAPDRHRKGTNALLCSPPTIISPQFGVDSFKRHCEAAISVGISPRVIATPALAFDIDAAEDLSDLRRRSIDGSVPPAVHRALGMREPSSVPA